MKKFKEKLRNCFQTILELTMLFMAVILLTFILSI